MYYGYTQIKKTSLNKIECQLKERSDTLFKLRDKLLTDIGTSTSLKELTSNLMSFTSGLYQLQQDYKLRRDICHKFKVNGISQFSELKEDDVTKHFRGFACEKDVVDCLQDLTAKQLKQVFVGGKDIRQSFANMKTLRQSVFATGAILYGIAYQIKSIDPSDTVRHVLASKECRFRYK